MSHDAAATLTLKSDWSGTSATAIIDELSGFRSVPAVTAPTSRQPGRGVGCTPLGASGTPVTCMMAFPLIVVHRGRRYRLQAGVYRSGTTTVRHAPWLDEERVSG